MNIKDVKVAVKAAMEDLLTAHHCNEDDVIHTFDSKKGTDPVLGFDFGDEGILYVIDGKAQIVGGREAELEAEVERLKSQNESLIRFLQEEGYVDDSGGVDGDYFGEYPAGGGIEMMARERMTDEELAQIKERAEKATEGPWKIEESRYEGSYNVSSVKEEYDLSACLCPIKDAEFIAHAREDIPKLLAEIEALRESKEYCKRLVSGLTRENALLKGEKPITVKLNGGDSE